MGREEEEDSGRGTLVYLWWIHVDIWQNQYNIVKLKKITFITFNNAFPCIVILLRVFIMLGCWILLHAFSSCIEMIIWCFSFFILLK